MRFKILLSLLLVATLAFVNGAVGVGTSCDIYGNCEPLSCEVTIVQTSLSGNLTNLTQLADTPDDYIGQAGNCTIVNSGETGVEFGNCATGVGEANQSISFNSGTNEITLDGGGGTIDISSVDTNETSFVTNLSSLDCPAGQLVIGIQNNGTVLCAIDADSGGGGLNTSQIYIVNDTTTISLNTTLVSTNLSVNSSNFWDGLNTFNTTVFEEQVGAIFGINFTWLEGFINAFDFVTSNFHDQDLNTTSDVVFNSVNVTEGNFSVNDSLFFVDTSLGFLGIGINSDLIATLTILGDVDVLHTATQPDDHAFEIILNASGFGDVKALDISYTTGNISTGEDESIILVNVDQSGASGGDVAALEVLTTQGSANIMGLEVGVLVNPIEQLSGIFGDMDSALSVSTDVLSSFISTASDVTIFETDDSNVTIGNTEKFQEIEFLLNTTASGSGIMPTFEFSTGVGTYASFTPTDGTNGLRNNGVILWLDSDIPSWVVGDNSEFLIRITRTRNSLATAPIESLVQISSAVEYSWNRDGDLNVSNITANNITANGFFIGDGSMLTNLSPGSELDPLAYNGTLRFTNNHTFIGDIEVIGAVNSSDWTNVSITESQISDLVHAVDTNETTRFDDLTAIDCTGTDKVIGIQSNGTVLCGIDQDSGGTPGLNTSQIYIVNDTTTISLNTTLVETNLSVNSSDFWDGLDTFNTTVFEEQVGAIFGINFTWLEEFINAFGFLTSFTELDPLAYNGTLRFTNNNTFAENVSSDIDFCLTGGGTCLSNVGAPETDPLAYNGSLLLTVNEGNLNVNGSNIWNSSNGTLIGFNTTVFEIQSGGMFGISFTWFEGIWDAIFGSKTTDDLTEGSTNLYDNQTWNQTGYYQNATIDFVQVAGDTMTGDLNINANLSTIDLNVSGFINHTIPGTIRTFPNGCIEVANSTGLFWIC